MSFDNPYAGNGASNPYANTPSTAPSWLGGDGGSAPSSGRGGGDLDSREETLRRREQELQAREQELDNRERTLRDTGKIYKPRPPNWPKWPKSLVHQDIDGDIKDVQLNTLVKKAFIAWHVLCFIMVWNLVAMTGVLAVRSDPGDFILAIVYFLIYLPLSFMWYRHLYNAARRGSSIQYFLFFFFQGFQVIAEIFWGLGVVGSGMAGFLWMIKLFSAGGAGSKIVGIFCLIGCAFWWLMAAFNAYVWIHARMCYKRTGGGRAKAEREFANAAGSAAANNPDMVIQGGMYAASRA